MWIDSYTLTTVWASMLGIIMMAGGMTWGWYKVRNLMETDKNGQTASNLNILW